MQTPGDGHLAVRVATYRLILYRLLERLALAGIIAPRDFDAIEVFAITIGNDLASHGSTEAQVNGARIVAEIRQYMEALR